MYENEEYADGYDIESSAQEYDDLQQDYNDALYSNAENDLRLFDYNADTANDNFEGDLPIDQVYGKAEDQNLNHDYDDSDAMSFDDDLQERRGIASSSNTQNHFFGESSEVNPSRNSSVHQPHHYSLNDGPYFEISHQRNERDGLRSIFEIPDRYRHIFSGYPCFNPIQSRVMDDILYSDMPVVVAAPTGSGKTVLFEMAIVRLLQSLENYKGDFKIVYMAPVKALCTERYLDWSVKFGPLGVQCLELTGDSDPSDYFELRDFQLLLTTPEKWDVVSRRWRDNKSLVQLVKLFLIDEVHLLSEERRGPVMEAVVSRMKTVQRSLDQTSCLSSLPSGIRFVAVSATVPNLEDVAMWLANEDNVPAVAHKLDEDKRPVPLKKVVLGFPSQESWSPFRFDLSLTYKLKQVLFTYSDNKPALVFCSTRKAVQQTTSVLIKDITFRLSAEQSENVRLHAPRLRDTKLRESVLRGVGCHHAGMDAGDRHVIEELFRSSSLPVLVATSTLAMGVNLPAHLVVVKSTEQYVGGMYREYAESSLLQMMGRAGRPQFDTSATAVIMTRSNMKAKYERLLNGQQLVESSLHRHLPEHLNAEVVLHTISDLEVALAWVRSTFLYVRAIRSPRDYGLAPPPPAPQPDTHRVEQKLQELCMRELNALASCEIVELQGMDVAPTDVGRLMARYYMALDSMKVFMKLTGDETLAELLVAVSRCSEFSEVQLRVNERRPLNVLNRCRGREVVRFPLPGRIKSRDMKVNVLVQAALGALPMPDPALHQETQRVLRVAQRVAKCLSEFLAVKRPTAYRAALSGARLAKAVQCRMWHDSPLVTRQLPRIGPAMAALLASAGKCSFTHIRDSNPRDLERILNRSAPLGNVLQTAVLRLPRYALQLQAERTRPCSIDISLELYLENVEKLQEGEATAGERHSVILLLAERSNNVLLRRERLADAYLMRTGGYLYNTQFKVEDEQTVEIVANCISESWVGLDVERIVRVDGSVTKQTATERTTAPRLIAATPRALRVELHKFVRTHVAKPKLAPTSTAAEERSSPAAATNASCFQKSTSGEPACTTEHKQQQPQHPTLDQEHHGTPVVRAASVPRGGISLREQIHAKYGHLTASLPAQVTRLTSTSTVTSQYQVQQDCAIEGDHPTLAKLPSITAAQSSHYASECNDFEDIDLDFDLGIDEFTTSSSMPVASIDRGADKKQESRNAKRKGPRSPVPVLNFDLGIDELLDPNYEMLLPRPVKRPIVTPVPRTPRKFQRTLSPPRHADELRNLVSSVLGRKSCKSPARATSPPVFMPLQSRRSSPARATSPPFLMPLQPRRSSLQRATSPPFLTTPFTNYEAQACYEEEQIPLECLSPRSFLRATLPLQGHDD